jgi:hypothetical protein
MEQKGQEIEAKHKRRQILLAMPKAGLQMVALGLEDVVIFVFDLPASTARLRGVRDVVGAQAMIGDKAIVIEWFARFGMHDRDREPIDRQGIVTTTPEHVIDVPIQAHFRAPAMPTAAFKLGHPVVGLPKRQPLRERGMGVRLARQDAVQALWQGQGTKRLLAVEIIAQSGHLMRRQGLGMLADPPFARLLFAVLFGIPVVRHDVLRGQGDDVRVSWAHDDGGDR